MKNNANNQASLPAYQNCQSVSLKEKKYVSGIMREVLNFVPREKWTNVVEVGSGGGRFTRYLKEMCPLVATDVTTKRFDTSITNNFCLMDGHDLALKDVCCDIVFCHFVLHHLLDLEKASVEMARIAAKYLVIIEPNPLHFYNAFLSLFEREEEQLRKFRMKRIIDSAEACGFEQVSMFSVGFLPSSMVPDFLINVFLKLKFHQPFGWDQVLIMKRV